MGYADLPPTDGRLTGYDSATAWVRAAHAFPGELVGVATGPLTNLALALRAEPALPTLLRQLVIMGGSYDHRGNTTSVAEWNISVDPEAAAEVFAAWPLEATGTSAASDPVRPGPDPQRRDDTGPPRQAGGRRRVDDDGDERERRTRHPVDGVQPVNPGDRGRDAVLPGGLQRQRARLPGASA